MSFTIAEINHSQTLIIFIALLAFVAVILTPGTSARQDTILDEQLIEVTSGSAVGATIIPMLWTAGGLSAGYDSAGQAARIANRH